VTTSPVTETEKTRYATVVTQVGALVPDFVEKGMLIFFGEGAPAELHDISVLHRPEVQVGGLAVGDILILDDHRFPILAVGHVANDNLVNLGHIDLKFNGETTPPLPGDVCLPKEIPPMLTPGSTFRVVGPSPSTQDN
jgi:PTS system glucitol/sorbitol-specific IIA component